MMKFRSILAISTLSLAAALSAAGQEGVVDPAGLQEMDLAYADPEGALNSTLESYSAVFGGVNEEELTDYLQKSRDTQALAEKLEAEIPNSFGGIRVLPSKNFRAQVYIKGKAKQILSDYNPPNYLIAKPSKYSLVDLHAALDDLMSAMDGKQITFNAFIDVENQDVVVVHEDPKLIRPLIRQLLDKHPIRIVAEKWETKHLSRTVGGMQAYSSNGGPCSVGIAVRKGSKYGATTAGHCADNPLAMEDIDGNMGVYTNLEEDYYQDWPPMDLQWHTAKVSSDSALAYVRASSGYWKVRSYGGLNVGDVICASGAKTHAETSKIACGYVQTTTHEGYDADHKPFSNAIIWEHNGNAVVRKGDSGGPLWQLRPERDGVKITGWMTIAANPIKDTEDYTMGVGQSVYRITERGLSVRGYTAQ